MCVLNQFVLHKKPDGEDEIKRRQLIELAVINGTYRNTNSQLRLTQAQQQADPIAPITGNVTNGVSQTPPPATSIALCHHLLSTSPSATINHNSCNQSTDGCECRTQYRCRHLHAHSCTHTYSQACAV